MMEKRPAVYVLASKRNGTLYVGVTSELAKRVWQHRNAIAEGFTNRIVDRHTGAHGWIPAFAGMMSAF